MCCCIHFWRVYLKKRNSMISGNVIKSFRDKVTVIFFLKNLEPRPWVHMPMGLSNILVVKYKYVLMANITTIFYDY